MDLNTLHPDAKPTSRIWRQSISSTLLAFLLWSQSYGVLADASQGVWLVPSTPVSPPPQQELQTDRAEEAKETKKTQRRRGRLTLRGRASWYGPGFHGKPTASGEVFDQRLMTAAHKTLPLGSRAKVINLENGNSVEVTINDRGPFIPGRIIDLSRAAAGELGILESGVTQVRVEVLTASVG